MAFLKTILSMHRANIRHVARILVYSDDMALTGWTKCWMVRHLSQNSSQICTRFIRNNCMVHRTRYSGAILSAHRNYEGCIMGNQRHSLLLPWLPTALPECSIAHFSTSGPGGLPKSKDSQEHTNTKSTEKLSKSEAEKERQTDSVSRESEKDLEMVVPRVPEERKGIVARFKDAYKEYGKVLIAVHVATSTVWFGSFYYAASSGLDVIPLLEWIGFSETMIKPFKATGIGHVAVAYLMYKLATPARYTVSLAGTQLTVRQLRKLGYMKRVPKQDSLRQLWKDGSVKMKDKAEHKRDQFKERAEKVKDKFEERAEKVKDKFEERAEQVKDKFRKD